MEGQSGLSELSIISWVSAVEGCPLSEVPLYCYHMPSCPDVFINKSRGIVRAVRSTFSDSVCHKPLALCYKYSQINKTG